MSKSKKPQASVQPNLTVFHVDESGTLTMADFWQPVTRSEVYEHIAEGWSRSPVDLVRVMDACSPLAWEVHSLYSTVREQVEHELEEVEGQEGRSYMKKRRARALADRLEVMPPDSEVGAQDWVLSLAQAEFEAQIVPSIEQWFSQPPDWRYEDDCQDEGSTAQGAALQFFQGMDRAQRRVLGVKVVEGEHPGSSYYAAELTVDIEAANKAAEEAGIPVRFARQGA